MDWIGQQWPWLSALILALGKMINDHLVIKDHEQRIDRIEQVVQEQQVMTAEQSMDIKHIRNTVDAIAEQQGINREDIKEILKNRG